MLNQKSKIKNQKKLNTTLAAAFILLIFISSCKIRYSFTGADIPAEARSSSVAMFTNTAPLASPNLPLKITEKLKDQILAQTKLYMVQDGADLQFTGNITGYDIRPVAVQANETAALNRLTISVQVIYTNKFDEKKNFTQTFSRFTDYDSASDLTSVEDALMDEIVKQLVQDIFDRAFSNW